MSQSDTTGITRLEIAAMCLQAMITRGDFDTKQECYSSDYEIQNLLKIADALIKAEREASRSYND